VGTPGAAGGYVFLHSAVDGYSRLAHTEALPYEKGRQHRGRVPGSGPGVLAAHGIDRISRLVTDIQAGYRSSALAPRRR
jgi:hypothetical protein